MFYMRFKKKIYWKNKWIAHFLFFGERCEWIAQVIPPKMSDVSQSLRSLTKNERPWAIRSGRSEEMSDREQIAQVAHQKWANEWIAHFFQQITHLLIFGQKMSDSPRWGNSQPWKMGPQMWEFFRSKLTRSWSLQRMYLDLKNIGDVSSTLSASESMLLLSLCEAVKQWIVCNSGAVGYIEMEGFWKNA